MAGEQPDLSLAPSRQLAKARDCLCATVTPSEGRLIKPAGSVVLVKAGAGPAAYRLRSLQGCERAAKRAQVSVASS